MNDDVYLFDKNTGLVATGYRVFSDEQWEKRTQYWEMQNEIKQYNSELGGFIFLLYEDSKTFTEITPQTVARLVYLATFLPYGDNVLQSSRNTVMTKELMRTHLGLQIDTFNRFFDEATTHGYLKETDKGIVLCDGYFRKGKIQNIERLKRTKVYIKSIRALYQNTPPSKHRYLGYLFMLLPFVNLEWNVLCRNPEERDIKQITPITIGDFCDYIGYKRTNAKRLIQSFRSIVFRTESGYFQRVCSFVYESDMSSMMIFCNPRIFYAGSDYRQVEAFGLFFRDCDINGTLIRDEDR